MKKNIYQHIKTYSLAIATCALCSTGVFSVSSCTDLDENPYTFMDPNAYYKDADELESALYTVYSSFRSMAGDYKYIMKLECSTDYGQPGYQKEDCNLINAWVNVNDASNSFANTWSRAYQTINRANVILGRGANIEMDETQKNQIFAQARFLRAYSYFYVLRLYGGCPISEKYTEGVENLELPRNTVDEVYQTIITDLEWCEQNGNLPKKGDASYDNWRVTIGAVHSLLSEVYLYRASMTDDSAKKNEYFQACKDYSWKVINQEDGPYELVKPYTDLWLWFNANAKNNIESIFELQYAPVTGQDTDLHRQFGVGIQINDAAIGSYMYHRYNPAIYRIEEYADNDDRKKCFLTKVVLESGENAGALYEYVRSDKGAFPGSKNWQTTAPGNIKYYDNKTDYTLKKAGTNFYILRLSEILLNYAEAANQLTPGDGIAQLNEVRTRAGLAPLSGLSQEALDDSIFIERGREFIGEAKIYYDEIRTDRLGKRVYDFVKRGVEEGYNFFQDLQFVPQKNFLWKIPQTDLDSSNGAMEQNPDNVSDPRYPL